MSGGKRCLPWFHWFHWFHDWSRWGYAGSFLSDKYQERECLRCGISQQRKVGYATQFRELDAAPISDIASCALIESAYLDEPEEECEEEDGEDA